MSSSRLFVTLGLGVALLVAGCSSAPPDPEPPAAPAAPAAPPAPVAGMAVYPATGDVAATVDGLEDALGEAGMVVATVDHAENAESVGQQLRPTTLVVGGNPEAGTPIQQESTVAGIDLPAKFLVWQDEAGAVWLGHNTAEYLAARAGVPGDSPAVGMLGQGLGMLARTASGSEQPVSPGTDLAGVGGQGYVRTVESPRPAPEVADALQEAVEQAGLSVVADVDHAENAESVGAQLPPSSVLLAGNPEVGTQLLQQQQTMGIDLPTRYLTWSEGPRTLVGFPEPAALAQRHGLDPQDPTVMMVAQAQERTATTAAAG